MPDFALEFDRSRSWDRCGQSGGDENPLSSLSLSHRPLENPLLPLSQLPRTRASAERVPIRVMRTSSLIDVLSWGRCGQKSGGDENPLSQLSLSHRPLENPLLSLSRLPRNQAGEGRVPTRVMRTSFLIDTLS